MKQTNHIEDQPAIMKSVYRSPELTLFGDWRRLTLGNGPNSQLDAPNNTKANLG